METPPEVADVETAAWELLKSRAKRGDRTKFLEVLAKVPDVEPEERDRLMR